MIGLCGSDVTPVNDTPEGRGRCCAAQRCGQSCCGRFVTDVDRRFCTNAVTETYEFYSCRACCL